MSGRPNHVERECAVLFPARGVFIAAPSKLVQSIKDISVIRTETEAEALIVEARLIKQYQPFFNIDLKMGEEVSMSRSPKSLLPAWSSPGTGKDGAVYIGPFVSAGELRQMLRLVERYFLENLRFLFPVRGKWQ